MFVSALPDPTCNSEKSANGGNKQILLLLLLLLLLLFQTSCVYSPCRNGGTCVSSFNHHTFYCNCREGFVGVSCEVGNKR